jgi:hypothetical protein
MIAQFIVILGIVTGAVGLFVAFCTLFNNATDYVTGSAGTGLEASALRRSPTWRAMGMAEVRPGESIPMRWMTWE